MPNYRRAKLAGGTYFFTVTTYRRRRFLLDADVRAAIRAGIDRIRTTLPFQIDAWVLLPDHLHCIWTLPPGDEDFSTRWKVIKITVTQHCRARLEPNVATTKRRDEKNQSTLWQNRFWEHQIRDERDFEKHVDYIHWNPVKHGYVSRAGDWEYSSLQRFIRSGVLQKDWFTVGTAEDGDFGE
jgi:putative transposase